MFVAHLFLDCVWMLCVDVAREQWVKAEVISQPDTTDKIFFRGSSGSIVSPLMMADDCSVGSVRRELDEKFTCLKAIKLLGSSCHTKVDCW